MFEVLTLIIIGCVLGVITGITPGLHVNTVCLIGLAMYPRLGLDPVGFAIPMTSMAITHTFLDFIPAIFLGVPEEETALGVLPAHQLVLQGKAMEAVKLTAYGSIMGVAFALALLPIAIYVVPIVYSFIRGIVVYVIVIASIILMIFERRPGKILFAAIIFALSGLLGVITLDLSIISSTQVLFPVFAGLFGLSTVITSLGSKTELAPQEKFTVLESSDDYTRGGILGAIGGMIVGILPAMSPSQIGILMYEIIGSNIRGFLVSISAINTSDAIYSMISLYTIHNPRSGVAVLIGKIIEMDYNTMVLLVGVMATTTIFATIAHLAIGKIAVKVVDRIDYRLLNISALTLVIFLVTYFTGVIGIGILALSTVIGMLPIFSGVSRTHLMGVLIIPTVLYFIG